MSNPSLILPQSPAYGEDYVYAAQVEDGAVPLYNVLPLTFTRASGGTRINKDGLVQNMPYNLLEYSEDFGNAYWQNYALTITTNTTTAPNGSNTADTFTSTGNFGGVMYKINQQSAGVYTTSVYVKAGNFDLIRVGVTDNGTSTDRYCFLNLSTLVVTNFGGASGTVQSVGNGWYRFMVSFTSTGNFNFFYGLQPEGTSGKYAYFWGAQLNIGSTAQPYLATTDRLNMPRITYPVGGGCGALLLEKQSTNLLTYSEQFDNAAWTKLQSSVSANQTTSPDGTQNADKVIPSTVNTYHYLEGSAVTVSNNAMVSIYAKKGEYQRFCLRSYITGNNAIFDVNSGTVVGTTNTTASIENIGNGWYRCSLNDTNSTAWGVQIFVMQNTSTNPIDSYSGNGTDGMFFWGAQVEVSSYATSYIPTTSTSATRIADACYKTGISNLIGQTEGVIFMDAKIIGPPTDGSFFGVQKSASNFVIRFGYNNLGFFAQVFNGSSNLLFETISYTLGTRIKIALAYKASNYAVYANGTQMATGTNATTIPACDEVMTNSLWGSANPSLYEINQAILYPTRLTNAELATLTTI